MRGAGWGAENAGEVIYRLGLRALPVSGLPEEMRVADTEVRFVRGPVVAQRTYMRQRSGLPIVFDKHMVRKEVGSGDLIAVLAIRTAPVPSELENAFAQWRASALAAAGMVAAVLDERVVGEELFEDAVLLSGGEFLGAIDLRSRIRSFLPFEVNLADEHALEQLADADLTEGSPAARAARLYRRASLEGPTADAYAMLWVAAECFSEDRSPSRRHLEAALRGAGLDPDGLPIPVGRLIELRGKIQHNGLEADDRLQTAFYEMEAVVRALIRQSADLRGGWWPAPNNPAAFADPFKPAVARFHDQGSTEWHQDSLPEFEEPGPLPIPRQVPNPVQDPRLDIDSEFGEATGLVASIVADALEWQDANVELSVKAVRPSEAPAEMTSGAGGAGIWLGPELLDGHDDPERPQVLINLVWEIHSLVGAAIAQRAGMVSRNDGVIAVEAVGSYLQYQRLVNFGMFPEEDLQIPEPTDRFALGKIAGWAAAGNRRAKDTAGELTGRDAEVVGTLIEALETAHPGPPTWLLELAEDYEPSISGGGLNNVDPRMP